MKKLIFALTMSLIIPASTSCSEDGSKKPSNGTLAFGAVLVLAAGGAYYYYSNKSSTKQQTPTPTNDSKIIDTAKNAQQNEPLARIIITLQPTPPAPTASLQKPSDFAPTSPKGDEGHSKAFSDTATEKPILVDKPKKTQPAILVTEPKKATPSAAAANNKSFRDCLHTTVSSSSWDQFVKNNIELYDY
jgi:hypothetical protein